MSPERLSKPELLSPEQASSINEKIKKAKNITPLGGPITEREDGVLSEELKEHLEVLKNGFTTPLKTKDWAEFFGVQSDATLEDMDQAARRLYNMYDDRKWAGTSHEDDAVAARKRVSMMLNMYKREKTGKRKKAPAAAAETEADQPAAELSATLKEKAGILQKLVDKDLFEAYEPESEKQRFIDEAQRLLAEAQESGSPIATENMNKLLLRIQEKIDDYRPESIRAATKTAEASEAPPTSTSLVNEIIMPSLGKKDTSAETAEGQGTSPEDQEKIFTEKIAAASNLAELYTVLGEIGTIEGSQGALTAEQLKDSIEQLCALGKADMDQSTYFWTSGQVIYTERYGLRAKVGELYKKEVNESTAPEAVAVDPAAAAPEAGNPGEPEYGPHMPTLEESREEYARAVQEMEGRFKGVRSLTSLPGMRKGNLLKGIEYVSEHKNGRTESLEEQLRQKGVHEKDIDIAAQIVRAREMHVDTRAREAQKMLAEKEGILRASGMPEEQIKTELAMFKATTLFDTLIVKEQALLDQAKIEIWPPKKKSAVRETLETMHKKWSALPRAARIGITTGLFTLAAFGAGAFAATGAIGAASYMSGKAGRSLASGVLAHGGMWGGGKAQEVVVGKRRDKKAASEAALAKESFTSKDAADIDAWKAFIGQTDTHHQESLNLIAKNKRSKAIWKMAGGVLIAGGSSIAAQQFAEHVLADVHISHEDIARPAVAPAESVDVSTQESAASIHGSLPDAPDSRAAAAVGSSIEHPAVTPESLPRVTIQEHGNVWNSAKELQNQLNLSDKEFADAWAHSKVTLNGQEVPLSGLDLVHKGDALSFVPGEDGAAGHFKFSNDSDIRYGETLPGEGKPAAGFREMSIKEVVAADNDGLGPTIEVTDPYAHLDANAGADATAMRSEEPWRQRSAEAHDSPLDEEAQKLEEADRLNEQVQKDAREIQETAKRMLREHAQVLSPDAPVIEWNDETRLAHFRVHPEDVVPDSEAFDLVLNNRVHSGLDTVFSGTENSSRSWNVWRGMSVRQVLDTSPESFTENTPGLKLQQYVQELIKETGTRPRFRLFGNETVEEFIERANERGLKADIRAARASLR